MNPENIEYIVAVQCHIVKERCSGYFCEKAFNERAGGFEPYPAENKIRYISFTCGGCCGIATLRKLHNFVKNAAKHEGISKDKISVHLSSCITKDNYHSSRCVHIDVIKEQINKEGLNCVEDTKISLKAEARRKEGVYKTY